MKTRMLWVGLVALLAACGGPVQPEDEASLGEPVSEAAPASRVEPAAIIVGVPNCGTNTCAKGTYCCNSSCGWCAPTGGGCPQVVCDK